ncbi:MAG: alpha/beta hydrolase [Cellvibrionales bacterium]|nr:alpha/beta hydrolase [Cellvibrionales bacterium]
MAKKTPLVLLPGMLCDGRMWQAQVSDLAAICDPLIIGDISRASSIRKIAQQVLATAPGHFALAGLSMGGIVALEIVRQAPERITHLALLDTNAYAEKPERQAKRAHEIDCAQVGQLRKLMIEQMKPLYLAKANRQNQTLLHLVLDMAMDLGPDVFERQSIALRDRPDASGTLATIRCPTLVLCGAEDALCPVAYHQYMQSQIPNARLEIIDNCGHLSALECPQQVNTHLRQWLQ